ncbi:hypothetical protein TeGR_g14091 [Tetraparma gracilis]|uniref:J domain-containing protein n=1 Tax=Tetraparma gracilis TaxID=2962635 RepID=A0ABQ6MNE7_9STRA|nr:hypothetical protein TeGR_g14091 [Tetraparma gracilis]
MHFITYLIFLLPLLAVSFPPLKAPAPPPLRALPSDEAFPWPDFDPFLELGLPRSATAADVKARYRSLAKLQHADAVEGGGSPDVKEGWLRLKAAHEVLSDRRRRLRYERARAGEGVLGLFDMVFGPPKTRRLGGVPEGASGPPPAAAEPPPPPPPAAAAAEPPPPPPPAAAPKKAWWRPRSSQPAPAAPRPAAPPDFAPPDFAPPGSAPGPRAADVRRAGATLRRRRRAVSDAREALERAERASRPPPPRPPE